MTFLRRRGPAPPAAAEAVAPPSPPSPFELAEGLAHGAPCDNRLVAAVAREIDARRRLTDTLDGPPAPLASDLQVRREGLPEWWAAGGNLMLAAPDATVEQLRTGMSRTPPTGALVVLGRGARLHSLDVSGRGSLLALGDRVNFYFTGIAVLSGATVLIGEGCTSTLLAHVDARNGGMVSVGADGMWANGVGLMSDDMHAIRDLATGRRVNAFGGRIVIAPHVWLGEHVKVLCGSRIGADTVVGLGSLVKNTVLPPNSVCLGRPAKPVRSGVTWSREDLP